MVYLDLVEHPMKKLGLDLVDYAIKKLGQKSRSRSLSNGDLDIYEQPITN